MNKAIYFKTARFDVSKEIENPINPIYGISLLEWLYESLKGTFEITEPSAEDWGWYCYIKFNNNNYLIGSCTYYENGDDPTTQLEWVFQVDKMRSLKEKIFGKNKMSIEDECFVYFKELFENQPDFSEVEIG